MQTALIVTAASVLAVTAALNAAPNTQAIGPAQNQPAELGDVAWSHDFEGALASSKESGKPVLVLFDEVPGCHTCLSYGSEVLSNPLVVDAAMTLFHPVTVYNNIEGTDRTILESFGEPTWNNPVVRVIDHKRAMLAPRVNGDYSTLGMTDAMIAALKKTGRDVPAYLRLLNEESHARDKPLGHATFAMHCFWEGQAHLGALEGVVETKVGFLNGLEVVDVTYDADRIEYEKLVRTAQRMNCASKVYARTDGQLRVAKKLAGDRAEKTSEETRHSERDELYRLANSSYKFVPLTPLQAQRINAVISEGGDPSVYLSPSQLKIHAAVLKHPRAGWHTPLPEHNTKDEMDAANRVLAKASD